MKRHRRITAIMALSIASLTATEAEAQLCTMTTPGVYDWNLIYPTDAAGEYISPAPGDLLMVGQIFGEEAELVGCVGTRHGLSRE